MRSWNRFLRLVEPTRRMLARLFAPTHIVASLKNIELALASEPQTLRLELLTFLSFIAVPDDRQGIAWGRRMELVEVHCPQRPIDGVRKQRGAA